MAGFKRLPDGSIGQAELMGSTRPGDALAEVDGVVVSDMSFDKVRRRLREALRSLSSRNNETTMYLPYVHLECCFPFRHPWAMLTLEQLWVPPQNAWKHTSCLASILNILAKSCSIYTT